MTETTATTKAKAKAKATPWVTLPPTDVTTTPAAAAPPQLAQPLPVEMTPIVTTGVGYLKNWVSMPRTATAEEQAVIEKLVALALDVPASIRPVHAELRLDGPDFRGYRMRIKEVLADAFDAAGVHLYRGKTVTQKEEGDYDETTDRYAVLETTLVEVDGMVLLDGWLVGPANDPLPMWLVSGNGTVISLWQCTQRDLNFVNGTRLASMIEFAANGQRETKTKAFTYDFNDAVRQLVRKRQLSVATLLATEQQLTTTS